MVVTTAMLHRRGCVGPAPGRGLVVGLGIVAGFFASQSAFVLVINLRQLGLGWTPLHTGLALIPWALGTAVAVLLAGAVLAEKLGRATLHLGLFVPLFDFILGDASTDEVGTGAGLLNAVQQFAGAIGVAALGMVFFARAGHPAAGSYFAAAELVFGIAAGLYLLTLLLVGLLPRHSQRAHG